MVNFVKWGVTTPLEGFSSLHEISFLYFFRFKVLYSFNLLTPPPSSSEALLIFHVRDADKPKVDADFSITGCTRWEVDVSRFNFFSDFLETMNSKHYHKCLKTEKIFIESGATITRIEGDWSDLVDAAYPLYEKVAKKHGTQMYDKSFFYAVSKLSNYKLICAWYQGTMIGMNILIEEAQILHSMCGGLDYVHSTPLQVYSQLNYEYIRWTIELKKFTIANVGMTADQAKHNLGYAAVSTCLDIKSSRPIVRGILRFLSTFITASITSEAKLKLRFGFFGNK